MKWGIRNYQNEDGTLTAAGKVRYSNNLNPGAKVLTNDRLKLSYDVYNEQVKKKVDLILDTYRTLGRDATKEMFGIDLKKDPESIKDMEPIYTKVNLEVYQNLFGNMDDEKQAMILAYMALVDAGLGDYFNVGIQTDNGRESVFFMHKDTGAICKTLTAAKVYMKTIGAKQREKNVQGKSVSVKVNKDKSVSSKPVGNR